VSIYIYALCRHDLGEEASRLSSHSARLHVKEAVGWKLGSLLRERTNIPYRRQTTTALNNRMNRTGICR